jgi:hypothetical protein
MCDSTTTCGMSNPKTFDAIDGTPIKYANSCSSYTQQNVRAETSFYNKCVNWIGNLRYFSSTYGGSSFNTLQWLGHVGFYVCKTPSCHAAGLAMDLDHVKWNSYNLNICTDPAGSGSTQQVRRRYLAVDGSLRRTFQWTLDRWYNAEHQNHIHASAHFDSPVLHKSATSDTVFVQAVCNNFNGAGLSVDGVWGSQTQSAWNAINNKWGYNTSVCNPENSTSAWAEWCNQVMRHGFADAGAGKYQSSCH